MNIKSFFILGQSGQFSLVDKPALLPVINIEKHNAFQLIDNKPFHKDIACDLINCGCRINSFIWISHNRKAIYFENPKSGSSSIKAMLGIGEPDLIICLIRIFSEWFHVKNYLIRINDYNSSLSENNVAEAVRNLNDIVKNNTTLYNGSPVVKNYTNTGGFELYFGERSLLDKLFPDYYAFSITRNPLDRFISNYLMFIQKNYRIIQLETLGRRTYESLSLSDFINLTLKLNNHHWNRQSTFIPELISGFHNNFVGKLENFHDDWKLISEKLEIEFKPAHKNKTEQEACHTNYPKEFADIITKLYQEDFNRFYQS